MGLVSRGLMGQQCLVSLQRPCADCPEPLTNKLGVVLCQTFLEFMGAAGKIPARPKVVVCVKANVRVGMGKLMSKNHNREVFNTHC